jgi:hypothetical protein
LRQFELTGTLRLCHVKDAIRAVFDPQKLKATARPFATVLETAAWFPAG